jgi:gamma-glutamylcyclotransferase (GGCT)/AIG2-like uncharacterized protein YtfP
MTDTPHLFVYGTLRRDAETEMSLFLGRNARFVDRARATGRLYHLGSFPGMILSDDPRDSVIGEVHELHHPAITWPILDEYEGEDFARQMCRAQLDDGRTIDVWTYTYARDTSGKPRIESGDYLEALKR